MTNSSSSSNKSSEFQKFLDNQQYNRKGILIYERIFGRTYVSTGGQATTTKFCQRLNLQPGQKVLDIGCGIGGSAFHLARQYGVDVYGVDLSTNMVQIANDYREEMEPGVKHRVQFHVADATTMDYPDNFYDVVYSRYSSKKSQILVSYDVICRDTILHIDDKLSLFQKFFKCLKPGGQVLITDYCHGDKAAFGPDFEAYVKQRGYHLLTPKGYGQVLEKAGFDNVDAQDITDYFIEILRKELNEFGAIEQAIVQEFSKPEFDKIINGWNDKVVRCNNGDQVWGYFYGKKLFS